MEDLRAMVCAGKQLLVCLASSLYKLLHKRSGEAVSSSFPFLNDEYGLLPPAGIDFFSVMNPKGAMILSLSNKEKMIHEAWPFNSS